MTVMNQGAFFFLLFFCLYGGTGGDEFGAGTGSGGGGGGGGIRTGKIENRIWMKY